MKKYLLVAAASALILANSSAYALFTNGGFETGDDTGWAITGDHSVISSYTEQFNNTSGWVSGIPYFGNYSLLLGSPGVGFDNPDNGHTSSANQTGTITQDDIDKGLHLYFRWGALLEEPTNGVFHDDPGQPYFSIKISGPDTTIIYYEDHRANQPGFLKVGTNSQGDAGDIWYGTHTADFDLTSLALGDQVKVDLYVQDCGLGGHGGLVFLDGFGTEKLPPDGVVPEPATMVLMGIGIFAGAGLKKKRIGG